MQRSEKVLLSDTIAAAESIETIVSDATLEKYLVVRVLRSAVEREFLIIGEALNSLDAISEDARGRVTHLGRIIGLRNRLAHAYDLIDDSMVWAIATEAVPQLLAELRLWLAELM